MVYLTRLRTRTHPCGYALKNHDRKTPWAIMGCSGRVPQDFVTAFPYTIGITVEVHVGVTRPFFRALLKALSILRG